MARISLKICGICVLTAGLAQGQQRPLQPQIRTGTGATAQQPVKMQGTQPRVVPGAIPTRGPGLGRPAMAPVTPTPTPTPSPATAQAAQPMQPPMQPMKPSDMPPVPPQVTYRNGMLTVNAVNSTLNSLLTAIRNKTGIEFDGAEGASDRVAVTLGPAAEGEVLAGIFSGSGFDYVVLGRADSPGTVQRVILTPKSKGGAMAAGNVQRPQQAPVQQEGDEDAPEEVVNGGGDPETPQDTAMQPPTVTQPATPEPQPQPNAGPKTPEQLLQELKQMQLQQQQQQGQPPPDPNSVPRKPPPQ